RAEQLARVARVAAAGSGNVGEPPGQTCVSISAAAGMTAPRYVPDGLARQPLRLATPPGPSTLIWLAAIPVTLLLNDCARTVPPAGAPPVVSPAAWTKAGRTPVPKATSLRARMTMCPPFPPLLIVEALACNARPNIVTV